MAVMRFEVVAVAEDIELEEGTVAVALVLMFGVLGFYAICCRQHKANYRSSPSGKRLS